MKSKLSVNGIDSQKFDVKIECISNDIEVDTKKYEVKNKFKVNLMDLSEIKEVSFSEICIWRILFFLRPRTDQINSPRIFHRLK